MSVNLRKCCVSYQLAAAGLPCCGLCAGRVTKLGRSFARSRDYDAMGK
jgi:hypothetical protein